ncbi:MAG TPA: hypothetical protein VMT35_00110 [Ignavibacteriaceae bacterium]|nr:hypothetical protein [Ignavibacteriaceae bacterium]
MKSIHSFKYFLFLILVSIFLSAELYSQKDRTGRNSDRNDMGDRNVQPGNNDQTANGDDERKVHTGIIIDRPERYAPDPILPKRNDPPPYNPPVYNPPPNNPPANDPIDYNPPQPDCYPPEPPPYEPPPYNPPEQPVVIVVEPEEPIPEINNPKEPEEPLSHIKSGLAKIYDLDYTGALEDFSYAIEKDTSNYKLYYYRGFVFLNLKDYIKSIKDFDIYLKYFFYDDEGFFQRALAKFYLGEKIEALEDFQTAADLGHKKAEAIIKKFYQ